MKKQSYFSLRPINSLQSLNRKSPDAKLKMRKPLSKTTLGVMIKKPYAGKTAKPHMKAKVDAQKDQPYW